MTDESKVPTEKLPEDGKDLAALLIEHEKRLDVHQHDLGAVIHNVRRLEMIVKALVKKVDELDKRGGGGIEVAQSVPRIRP